MTVIRIFKVLVFQGEIGQRCYSGFLFGTNWINPGKVCRRKAEKMGR